MEVNLSRFGYHHASSGFLQRLLIEHSYNHVHNVDLHRTAQCLHLDKQVYLPNDAHVNLHGYRLHNEHLAVEVVLRHELY